MEGKLIKLGLSEGYRLDDLNGNYIASTLNGKNKLSLKNCEAIENGYDLDELAKIEYPICEVWNDEEAVIRELAFKKGFQKALEILGDKKFSEDDMRTAFYVAIQLGMNQNIAIDKNKPLQDEEVVFNKSIQSLQQTEWDCTFNPDEKDSDGCLILKRK